jgi:hypothetical protein
MIPSLQLSRGRFQIVLESLDDPSFIHYQPLVTMWSWLLPGYPP